jgi:hypothetical protein
MARAAFSRQNGDAKMAFDAEFLFPIFFPFRFRIFFVTIQRKKLKRSKKVLDRVFRSKVKNQV